MVGVARPLTSRYENSVYYVICTCLHDSRYETETWYTLAQPVTAQPRKAE